MAKKIIRRRKARKPTKPTKPEVYEVEGQKLSADQWQVYCHKRQEWLTNAMHRAQRDVDSIALENLRYSELATTQAQDRFGPLFHRTSDASLAIGSLSHLKFYGRDEKLIGLGNDIIRHCAEELWAVVSELNSIHEGIAKQIAPEVAKARKREVAHG